MTMMNKKKEVKPLYSTVLVELYETNPYEVHESETGLKLSNGSFDSPDTGNRERKEHLSTAARVIEVGPTCKYARPGDDCLIDLRTTRPICFNGHYYFNVAEQNIIALLGDDLTTRFNNENEL